MADSYYPHMGFHFSVAFEGLGNNVQDTMFQQVTGLEANIEMEDYPEGGFNTYTRSLPVKTKYSDLALIRGTQLDSAVAQWFKKGIEEFKFQPVDLMISLLNKDHQPLVSWNVIGAVPLSWKFAELNAEESKIHIETFTLRYLYFITIFNN